MPNDLSVWTMVLDASPIVQAVVAILMFASVASWAIIFRKSRVISQLAATVPSSSRRSSGRAGISPPCTATSKPRAARAPACRASSSPASASSAGCASRAHRPNSCSRARGARCASRRCAKSTGWRRNLATLATVGSTSPYVGLFGTVWGIMSAFHNLGNVQQATLAAVAPGIAEALITTAMGLFAAIPAVVAYNRLRRSSQPPGAALRYLRRGVLDDLAAPRFDPGAGVAHARAAASSTLDGRDQRRAVHRRHAGAVDHLHDHGAAAQGRRQSRFARRRRQADRCGLPAEA